MRPSMHFFDEIILAGHVALDVVSEPSRQFLFQPAVDLRVIGMRDHIVSEIRVPFYLRASHLKSMHMVGSMRIVSFDEETPARNTELPLRAIAELDHLLVKTIYPLDVSHRNEYIDDWLGADRGDGRAADVMNSDDLNSEQGTEPAGLQFELLRPVWAVWEDFDCSYQCRLQMVITQVPGTFGEQLKYDQVVRIINLTKRCVCKCLAPTA